VALFQLAEAFAAAPTPVGASMAIFSCCSQEAVAAMTSYTPSQSASLAPCWMRAIAGKPRWGGIWTRGGGEDVAAVKRLA